MAGRIPARAFASMVFPDPGGPCMRILCHQAAAISRALFACSWPWIEEKSIEDRFRGRVSISIFLLFGRGILPVRISTRCFKLSTHITSISGITDASVTFARGRKIYFIPSSRTRIVAGSAHCTDRTVPSRASSPRKSPFSMNSLFHSNSFQRIPRAIGRS